MRVFSKLCPCVTLLVMAAATYSQPLLAQDGTTDQPLQPSEKQAWAAKLAALQDSGWREAFQLGLELADLPPDDGFAILKQNWPKIGKVESRQQILKAWHYTLPYPLHARNHPHIREVLELGMHDRSTQVRKWARDFLAEVPENSGKKPPADAGESESAEGEAPSVERRAGGDARKRYFLVGPADAPPPPQGYGLLIVLPGGDGSADFHPFIRHIHGAVLDETWLIAQPIAPQWDDRQFSQIVWPTARDRYRAAKFTTEQFIAAILTDIRGKTRLDPSRIFMLGWSSGGPPCYYVTLLDKSPVRGAFVAMSIFKPDELPSLAGSQGKAFYLLQSPDDRVTPIGFAEAAETALLENKATVKLERYAGGHGWQGDVWSMIADGTSWLEEQSAPAKTAGP